MVQHLGSSTHQINNHLALAPSNIPRAGKGVFATSFIPQGTYLGYYRGKKINSEENFVKKVESKQVDPNYAFDVNSGKRPFILDATNPNDANWTRFINCSRNEREENVIYKDENGKIEFYALKPIYPGTELLFYYGELYASKLGIKYQSKYYE